MKQIMGYSDKISVRPGETIKFMVSCEKRASYKARIVQIIHGDTNPEGPGYKERAIESAVEGTYQGRKQHIHAGSYAVIPNHRAFDRLVKLFAPGDGLADDAGESGSDIDEPLGRQIESRLHSCHQRQQWPYPDAGRRQRGHRGDRDRQASSSARVVFCRRELSMLEPARCGSIRSRWCRMPRSTPRPLRSM